MINQILSKSMIIYILILLYVVHTFFLFYLSLHSKSNNTKFQSQKTSEKNELTQYYRSYLRNFFFPILRIK